MKHRLDALIASDDIISTAVDIEIFVVVKYIINAVDVSRIRVFYVAPNAGEAEVTDNEVLY